LNGYSPEELDRTLRYRVSIIVQLIAVLSVLVACFPFVGRTLGLIDVLVSYRKKGWTLVVSLIGVALSSITSGWMLYHLLISK
jgi:hypothetical protein